jgi:hypothetical protein
VIGRGLQSLTKRRKSASLGVLRLFGGGKASPANAASTQATDVVTSELCYDMLGPTLEYIDNVFENLTTHMVWMAVLNGLKFSVCTVVEIGPHIWVEADPSNGDSLFAPQ